MYIIMLHVYFGVESEDDAMLMVSCTCVYIIMYTYVCRVDEL